ncbi:MAG: TetR family transcriptional regulator, partial [Ginsengibacter sp.]
MDKKETILKSALKLFSSNGYEGTGVRAIAKDANVNVAMINYYFQSKEGLFEKMVEWKALYIKELFADIVQNSTLSPLEKVEQMIDQLIERKFSDRKFHYLLHRELSLENRESMKGKIAEILFKNIEPVKAVIEEGIRKKVFKEVDIELTLTTIIGSIHYLLTSETMARKILGKKNDFNVFSN